MRQLPLMLCAVFFACGAPKASVPDAGVDSSCGLDCVAQARYGLTVGRCFEYSDALSAEADPALGVEVLPVFTLEGGVKVFRVEYTQGGQMQMRDSFALTNGDLVLVRREFQTPSVTYKNDDGTLSGVTWLKAASVAGDNFSTSTHADVASAVRVNEPTTYGLTLIDATSSERAVPFQTYQAAIKMLFSESPQHGADTRRIFVPGLGFILFSSSLSLAGSPTQEYRLQKIRNLNDPDAGSGSCGVN